MPVRKDRAVPIGGLAVASTIGMDLASLVDSLRHSRRGLTRDHRFTHWTKSPLGEIGNLEDSAPSSNRLVAMANDTIRRLDASTNVFARYAPEDIGLFIGTTTAALITGAKNMQKCFGENVSRCREFLTHNDQHASLTDRIKESFPIRGFDAIFSTACSAGALAIAEARDAINMGLCKVAIAGGFDVLNEITISGFSALQVMDDDFCRPFATNRRGMNLAEGGGLLLLERQCTTPLAHLIGVGAASEGYHMTHPDPSGAGMRLTMERALNDATSRPDEIQYINAHGTGTLPNDAAEQKAILEVFGDQVPYNSTKALHGHTLAGAGALEAAISIAALKYQSTWSANSSANRLISRVMSNSFGFGGNNVSLIFGGEDI